MSFHLFISQANQKEISVNLIIAAYVIC